MRVLFTLFLLGFSVLFINSAYSQESKWRLQYDQGDYQFNTARTPFLVLPNVIGGGNFQVAGGIGIDDYEGLWNRWVTQLDLRVGIGRLFEAGVSGSMGQFFVQGGHSNIEIERLGANLKWQLLNQFGSARPNILLEAYTGIPAPTSFIVFSPFETLGSSLRASMGWKIGQKNEVIANGRLYGQWFKSTLAWESSLSYRRWVSKSFGAMAVLSAGKKFIYPVCNLVSPGYPFCDVDYFNSSDIPNGMKGGVGVFGKLCSGIYWDLSGNYYAVELFSRYGLSTGITWDFGAPIKIMKIHHGNPKKAI